MSSPTRYVASCDLGGSKAAVGIVDCAGRVLAQRRSLLDERRAPHEVAALVAYELRLAAQQAGVDWRNILGVGCGIAAMIDARREIVLSAPTIGGWRNIPFRALLAAACELPVWLEMDAYAAALGEAWHGVGRGCGHFIYVVVGTGIGAGIVVDGRILRGSRGTAGEFGHTVIVHDGQACNCGGFGCLETLASGPAIAQRARQALLRGAPTLLAAQEQISAATVFAAARAGDEVALQIITETAGYLATGCVNLLHLLNPELLALGGGVARGGGDMLLPLLRREVIRRCGAWIDRDQVRIVLAQLDEAAGLVGAAQLVLQEHDRHG